MIDNILKAKLKVLTSDLRACKKQSERLDMSLERMKAINLSKKYLETATDDKIASIDSFILRFSRLQDMLGQKIFRRILELSGEDVGSMIDTLNKMDKIGILDDVQSWLAIRDIRNKITHDYDDSDELNYALGNLESVVVYTPQLLEVSKRAQKYIKEKFGI